MLDQIHSVVCFNLSNRLLAFDWFNILKLLLTWLMKVSSIVITHYRITLSTHSIIWWHFTTAVGSLARCSNIDCGLRFYCWLFTIYLRCFCNIQEGSTWVLLIANVTLHILIRICQIQCIRFFYSYFVLVTSSEWISASNSSSW